MQAWQKSSKFKLLKEYASVFAINDDQCFYRLFSKSGFTEGLQERLKKEEVKLVSPDQIYQLNPGLIV